MNNLYKTIGSRLCTRRKNLQLSQEYLAELTGLHRNYIGNIERGEKCASLANIYKIVIQLNMTLEELFKGF